MGRPQIFNEEKVIEKAMEMFWEKGFEGTSTKDLTEGTGISNGSFFHSFGDKKKLYIKCLQKYDRLYIDPIITLLDGPLPFKDKIRKLLTQATKTSNKMPGYEGCLVFNTTVDKGIADGSIIRLASAINKRIGDALESAIDRAKSNQELPRNVKTSALAHYLVTIINGIRVLLLNNPPSSTVRQIIDTTLHSLPDKPR